MKKFLVLLLAGLCLACTVRAEDDVTEDSVAVSDEGASSDANVSVVKFKDELAPHGRWVQVKTADYDWVFVPDEAKAPDWRPYVDGGHWIYTDAGWYWQSDYKWGEVCFHYGRWVSTEFGWAWVPGSQWAPAWVCWRECDTHYAWAPLPPCTHFAVGAGFFFRGRHCEASFEFGLGIDDFCFVPCGVFLDINIGRHRCHHDECVKIYNKTVIRNTYVYRNRVIQNHCFRKETVEARTHAKVESHSVAKAEIERSHKIAHEARVERNTRANAKAIHETKEARKDAHEIHGKPHEEKKVEHHAEAPKQQRQEKRQEKQEQRHEQKQQRQEQRQERRQAPQTRPQPQPRQAPPPPPQHQQQAPVQHHR